VSAYVESEPCSRNGDTCIRRLAAGWITANDLCPGCTRRFMAALDWISAEPLTWHRNYTERAEESGGQTSATTPDAAARATRNRTSGGR
jgi:hypothetical protein